MSAKDSNHFVQLAPIMSELARDYGRLVRVADLAFQVASEHRAGPGVSATWDPLWQALRDAGYAEEVKT